MNDLRGVDRDGKPGDSLIQALAVSAEDFRESGSRVHTVIESKPALAEKHMTGKFATQQRAGLLHLLFHEGVAGLPQHRSAAVAGNE